MPRHLITGGTGFVGSAIIIELLRRSSDIDLICLVRPSDRRGKERLTEKLLAEADRYGQDLNLYGLSERVDVIDWDITDDITNMPAIGKVDKVWHSAASLKYTDEDREEIFAHNVDGTRNILRLMHHVGADHFVYISTAYVWGPTSGQVLEVPRAENSPVNNVYEQSKLSAEALVLGHSDCTATILRPTIIVGHSDTFASSSSFGVYGFIKQLRRLAFTSQVRMDGYFQRNSLKIICDPDVPLNIVPIDLVAAAAVDLVMCESPPRIANIANVSPPTVGQMMETFFAYKGLKSPEYVSDKSGFSVIDAEFDRRIEFYKSYLAGHKTFSQDELSKIGHPIAVAYNHAVLERLYRTYEEDAGVGKKPQTAGSNNR